MLYSEQYDYYKQNLEDYIKNLYSDYNVPQENVISAMRYTLTNGGKRIRGVLVLHCAELFGADIKDALPVATAIEMIHAYALIHDDLPCMDNDAFRRGKPSCHIAFNEPTALLAGDGLLTHSFGMIAKSNISDAKKSKLIEILADGAGVFGMIGGQQIDLESEYKDVSEELLNELHRLKTGELIKAAVSLGCTIGDCSEEDYKKMQDYASKIGLVFQITDDMLDVTASIEDLGKPINSDSKNHKTTYVTKYGYDKSKAIATRLTNDAIEDLVTIDAIKGKQTFLETLAEQLLHRKK